MKKITGIYLLLSAMILNVFFGADITIYAIALLISVLSGNLIAYSIFSIGIIAETGAPILLIAYAIGGFILHIVPLIQDNNLKIALNKRFLEYTAPFFLMLSSAFALLFTSTNNVLLYAIFLGIAYLTKNFVTFLIFGTVTFITTSSPFLLLLYILGDSLVYLSTKVKEKYYIENSNTVYFDNPKTESINTTNENFSEKANTLNSLINELNLLKENITDNSIKNGLLEVLNLCKKIQANTFENNEYKINKLVNYYAPELIRILKDYIAIEKNDVISEENLMFKVEVMRILDTINKAFEKILQSLLDNTIKKSNIDIKVLEKILKDDNLL